ncbi:MAG TPA: 3-dehydroquinate synthase [Dissulfurispiraceae bacterium]|nr:3-dehydroquinate synthase [Dissulfurispiraceae bacterium]
MNSSKRVVVKLGLRSYDITIGSGILKDFGPAVSSFGFRKKICIISNPTVYGLYGAEVVHSLRAAGFTPFEVIIPDGERYKTLSQTTRILSRLLEERLDRKSCLIALGGGVIGDITGFVASLYMRGIPFVQMPTTLLAQVDSSVGGKTGVNHPLGKNMIGTFYQPRLVWIDTDTLRTLPRRQFLCGMAEVIKYGVIRDEAFFSYLERKRENVLGLNPTALAFIVKRSCAIKAEVVAADEREAGLRAILNYGHTIGHAIETETHYRRYCHGEAVAIGMHLAARLAQQIRLLDASSVEHIKEVIVSYGLPVEPAAGISAARLVEHMRLDKKAEEGRLTFVLPQNVGSVTIRKNVTSQTVMRILQRCCRLQ